jgi:drug/metabolite transporter (DMT)-like permease
VRCLSALGTNLAFLFKHRGAVAAPGVDMRHPLRSAVDLFRSRWWTIGWGVAAVAFALHVAALTLAPISIGQAVLAGGLVFLAVLAERFFGFELGRRQWVGIGLVAVSLALLTLTGGGGGEAHSGYSLAGMIIFESIAVGVGLILVLSHLIERMPVQRGVLLGIAAGLGFGISDVAIKALSGDLDSGPVALLSPWSVVIVTAAVFSFYASARPSAPARRSKSQPWSLRALLHVDGGGDVHESALDLRDVDHPPVVVDVELLAASARESASRPILIPLPLLRLLRLLSSSGPPAPAACRSTRAEGGLPSRPRRGETWPLPVGSRTTADPRRTAPQEGEQSSKAASHTGLRCPCAVDTRS